VPIHVTFFRNESGMTTGWLSVHMKPFVVLGASKTGTSTAVAVANAHPSVFCLFECDFSRAADYARNRDLVAVLPRAAAFFGGTRLFVDCLSDLEKDLAANGWRFDAIGTKVQGIRPDVFAHLGDVPVLFMVRDVRLWAVKNRVLRDVMGADAATNIAPFLAAYARYFLDSFMIERCRRLALDQVFSADLTIFPAAFSKLLEIPQDGFAQWWLKAPAWKTKPPKNYSDWINGHASAFLPPVLADTQSSLAPHPFWDEFLPIFDKYFRNTDKAFARTEIAQDQKLLDDLACRSTLTLKEGFTRFESFKIRSLTNGPDGKISLQAAERLTHTEMMSAAVQPDTTASQLRD